MTDSREFIKLDVAYLTNPKVVRLLVVKRPLAVLVHLECIAYCRRHRSNGIVPAVVAERAVIGATRHDVRAAVDAELLIDRGDGTLEVHDYLEHQQSAEQIEAASLAGKKAAETRWSRASRNADRTTSRNADRIADGNAEESREEKRTTKTSSPAAPATVRLPPGAFDQFWQLYPKKVGKDAARKAFTTAVRRAGLEPIVLGVKRYAADPNLPERQYVPNPATWLNQGRWDDEPCAPRTNGRPPERPRAGSSVWSQVIGGEPQ